MNTLQSRLQLEAEAYRAFDRWRAEHDPNGEWDVLEASCKYYAWAATNSIAPYLDDAQCPQGRRGAP